MKVSVIIPVYNIEAYIENCFSSIACQSYQHLEAIFIDDCGSDSSISILNNLISTYRGKICFKIEKMKVNGGLSAARNLGINVATGDYILFVDGDDCLQPNSIENLVAPVLDDRKIDFVYGQVQQLIDTDISPWGCPLEIGINYYPIEHLANRQIHLIACNKLVSRKFLIDNNLLFEKGILHEDGPWTFELCLKSKKCVCVRAETYIYRQRCGSITHKTTLKNVEGYSSGILKMWDLIETHHIKNINVINFVSSLAGIIFIQLSEITNISIQEKVIHFVDYQKKLNHILRQNKTCYHKGIFNKLTGKLIHGRSSYFCAYLFFSLFYIKYIFRR